MGRALPWNDLFGESADEMSGNGMSSPDPDSSVPQAEASQGLDRDERAEPEPQQFVEKPQSDASPPSADITSSTTSASNLWTGLLNLFKPQAGQQKPAHKVQKIYRRGQTMHHLERGSERSSHENLQGSDEVEEEHGVPRKNLVRGSSLYTNNSENGEVEAPPKTTFFESAGDLLNPPLPSKEFLLDPTARPRTIWHDRVYHPEDIPPPPAKRHRTLMMRAIPGSRKGSQQSLMPPDPASSLTVNPPRSSSSHSSASILTQGPNETQETGSMKIEEKIARAYHKDLSWRKVLVRLEPDAHNNMIVRRMFANAYGWPVVKHMCDTHFADTYFARTRDESEPGRERAKGEHEAPAKDGGETNDPDRKNKAGNNEGNNEDDLTPPKPLTESDRTDSERREATDALPPLMTSLPNINRSGTGVCTSTNTGPGTNTGPNSLAKALSGSSLTVPLPSPGGSRKSSSTGTGYAYESDTAWSERDWADSEFDSDDAEGVPEREKDKKRHSTGGEGWNWTEAIAGRGATAATSPKGTDKAEIDRFLGKGKAKEGESVSADVTSPNS